MNYCGPWQETGCGRYIRNAGTRGQHNHRTFQRLFEITRHAHRCGFESSLASFSELTSSVTVGIEDLDCSLVEVVAGGGNKAQSLKCDDTRADDADRVKRHTEKIRC